MGFNCLLADFVKQHQACAVIRGLRAVSDFEYEFQLASMNRRLDENIETLFMTPAEENTFLSSTLIREIALLGGNVEQFTPATVAKQLRVKASQLGHLS